MLQALVAEVIAHRNAFAAATGGGAAAASAAVAGSGSVVGSVSGGDSSAGGGLGLAPAGAAADELAAFWLRKTRKPVLAVLAVARPGQPLRFFRGAIRSREPPAPPHDGPSASLPCRSRCGVEQRAICCSRRKPAFRAAPRRCSTPHSLILRAAHNIGSRRCCTRLRSESERFARRLKGCAAPRLIGANSESAGPQASTWRSPCPPAPSAPNAMARPFARLLRLLRHAPAPAAAASASAANYPAARSIFCQATRGNELCSDRTCAATGLCLAPPGSTCAACPARAAGC